MGWKSRENIILAVVFFGYLMWKFIPHGIIECDDPVAIKISESLIATVGWDFEPITAYNQTLDLTIWHGNKTFGFGVATGKFAGPNASDFSHSCRKLLYESTENLRKNMVTNLAKNI